MHVLQNSKQECAMHQGKKALVYLSYSLKLLSDSLFIACDCLSKTINGILWFSMEWGGRPDDAIEGGADDLANVSKRG